MQRRRRQEFRPLNIHGGRQPDDAKLQELIVYISTISVGDKYYGATKLNKLLFYADFVAYRRYGKSITGQEYQALSQGPAPKRLKIVMEQLRKSGQVTERVKRFHNFTQITTKPLALADLGKFTQQEIALVHELVQRFWNHSARQISELSHEFIGWSLAEKGETIPYGVALLGREKLTEQELEHAKVVEERARKWLEGRAA